MSCDGDMNYVHGLRSNSDKIFNGCRVQVGFGQNISKCVGIGSGFATALLDTDRVRTKKICPERVPDTVSCSFPPHFFGIYHAGTQMRCPLFYVMLFSLSSLMYNNLCVNYYILKLGSVAFLHFFKVFWKPHIKKFKRYIWWLIMQDSPMI